MSKAGLEGVVVAETKLSHIDGAQGELVYAGYDIDDLARNTTFEEVCYLLWNGELPNREQLDGLKRQLAAEATVSPELLDMLRAYPREADPMAALRTAVSALGMFDPAADDNSEPELRRKSILLTAKTATLVAAFDRIRNGKEPVEPRSDLGMAANFLYMLNGEEGGETRVRTMDAALILHAE
ncbi:MAG TPA: citrate/2-methylcitrate synthase, partial [Longimicrobiaceae bacterium]|nr:citrate/2-methylcitrate synthase [Longimicrobiaceae bacterium]